MLFMLTATRKLTDSLVAKTAHCLGAGVDTPRLDAYLDCLFEIAATQGPVLCECQDDRILVKADDENVYASDVLRAKTKMRILCARLEKRASDATGTPPSNPGDGIAFEFGDRSYDIVITNSTVSQRISIAIAHKDNCERQNG